jgi:diguanylate cyclase (GGDEF)-like protein
MRSLLDGRLAGAAPSPWLDTIANAMLAAGRLDEATAAIETAIANAPTDQLEPECLPACMLTAARIARARGDEGAERRYLARAREIALDCGAPEHSALALKRLSELAAVEHDFEAAYTLLRRHLDEWDRYQTERSERHAATLQAIYSAEVERRRRIEVEQLADSDPLTGLWNRRYLERRLAELAGAPISLALLDLDHFKQVNDRFSHDAGDAVLRHVGELLELHTGGAPARGAFAARLGGEEFVLVFPGPDSDGALRLCERVRAHVQAAEWAGVAAEVRLTVSIGFVTDSRGSVPASELLSEADACLYEAKRRGRNRVVEGHR